MRLCCAFSKTTKNKLPSSLSKLKKGEESLGKTSASRFSQLLWFLPEEQTLKHPTYNSLTASVEIVHWDLLHVSLLGRYKEWEIDPTLPTGLGTKCTFGCHCGLEGRKTFFFPLRLLRWWDPLSAVPNTLGTRDQCSYENLVPDDLR